jgi:crossover junction endodeoxyribonuclease RuvC
MVPGPIRILGLDPGLQHTGWGLIRQDGSRLSHLGDGVISTDAALPLAERLLQLHRGLAAVIALHAPDEAAVERTYVARNPDSALKLGQARGVVLLAPALAGIPVAEYQAMEVKRAVVGTGHAQKEQVADMVRRLLPGVKPQRADAADALAVAICHAHSRRGVVGLARLAVAP